MRNLLDILVDAKDGKVPSHEECFWALLHLSAMNHHNERTLIALEEAKEKGGKALIFAAKLRLNKIRESQMNARKKTPQEYLGEIGNPFHPTNKAFTEMGEKIIEAAMKRVEAKEMNDDSVPKSGME